jgi:UDP-glucose 4-epimerase
MRRRGRLRQTGIKDNVLGTGGGGYIGRCITRDLLGVGGKIVVTDDLLTGFE